jgi:pimeloyl-ACP methyl ester carboxylesterase
LGKVLPGCLLPLLVGCCTAGPRTEVCQPPARPAPAPVGVAFVANGSGDFRTVSASLSQVVAETAAPLQVETFVWSHGYGRYVTDHLDHTNHLCCGRRLAEQVAAYRQAYPERRVYLIGHSAGCAVVLAAAEALPPDAVDRIVLLAPSVCVSYDLRPALRSARGGIDVFYSGEDTVLLGLGVGLVGTAEHACRTAAGQCGFRPVVSCAADAALYGKLRQHPWDPAVRWSGNDGGHYGSNRPGFLRAYVLPLLAGP